MTRRLCTPGVCIVCFIMVSLGGPFAFGAEPPAGAGTPLDEVPAIRSETGAAPGDLADQPAVQEHLATAEELIADQRYRLAEKELDKALQLARGDIFELVYLMAQVKHRLGAYGEARVAAELAGRLRSGDPEVHYLLGQMYREQDELDSAITHFHAAARATDARDAPPRATLAWYALGETLEAAGYWRAAAEAFGRFDEAVWHAHPDHATDEAVAALLDRNPRGMVPRRLELLERVGKSAERVRVAQAALESQPSDPVLPRLYVRTLLDAGQSREAFAFCRDRMADDAAAVGLTMTLAAAQAADELGTWVGEIVARLESGATVPYAVELADRIRAQGNAAVALPLYEALAAQDSPGADVVWGLALAQRATGDVKQALATLTAYLRTADVAGAIPPDRLARWMEPFDALPDFLLVVPDRISAHDTDAAEFTIMGATAAAAGETALAERLLGRALDTQADYGPAHLVWAQMELDRYAWEAAREHAEAALASVPDWAAAHLMIAKAHAGLDEDEAAQEAFEAAVAERPDDVQYVLALAQHYRNRGNLLSAQRYFQEAWSLDPTVGEAIEELVECYLESGKVEIARAAVNDAESADLPADVLRRLRTTLEYASNPMGPEHLAELQRQFEAHPTDVRTGLQLAAGRFVAGEIDAAWETLQRVWQQDAEDDRGLYLAARIHMQRLEFAEAIRVIEHLVERYPRRLQTLTMLADAYLADFRIRDGREVLRRILALELEPDLRERMRTQLLATHVDFAEYDAALDQIDAWLATDPNDPGWARAKLRVLLLADRPDEAVRLARERLQPATQTFDELSARLADGQTRLNAQPDDANLAAELQAVERELNAALETLFERRAEYVQVCLDGGRGAEAESAIREWQRVAPDNPQLQEWLIEALLAQEKAAAAMEAAKEYPPQTPGDVLKVFGWRARAHAQLDQAPQAIEELDQLLEEPIIQSAPLARQQVQQEIVVQLIDIDDHATALRRCDEWLRTTPADEQSVRLGLLLLKRMVLQDAERETALIETTRRLLEMQPRDPGLNNDLGYTLIDRGENLIGALNMVKLAVAAEPLNAAYLDSLGWGYYKLGDFENAQRYLSRAVKLRAGQDPILYDHLGDAEYRLGNEAAAREHWEKALADLEVAEREELTGIELDLMAALRAKLAALGAGTTPELAPIGEEQPASPATDDAAEEATG